MTDDTASLRAALAALIAARNACAEAGIDVRCEQIHGTGLALDAIASVERRALPSAFGDEVMVRRNYVGGDDRLTVARMGRTIVYLTNGRRESPFSIEDGHENDKYRHREIGADDLFRIKRDLVGKRPPKPAPVPQEIATVTKVKK